MYSIPKMKAGNCNFSKELTGIFRNAVENMGEKLPLHTAVQMQLVQALWKSE